MAAFLDGCRFNPTAGGTTDWTFSSAVTGYQIPAAANVVNGRLYKYRAESADLSQWEFGEGAYNTGTGVLARTTVLFNSSGTTSKINFSTVPQVAIVALKEDLISIEEANSFTDTQKAQARSNLYAAPFDAMAYNNMAINGTLDVLQEFTAGTFPVLASGTSKYCADMWETQYVHGANTAVIQSGQSNTVTSTAGPAGIYNNYLFFASTAISAPANGDYGLVRQKIEGHRMANMAWGTANARSLAYAVQVYSGGATGVTFLKLSNGAKNRCYYVEVTIASGWNVFSGSIPGDQSGTWAIDNTIGLQVEIFCAGKAASPVTAGSWSATSTTQTTNSVNLCGTNGAVFAVTGLWLCAGTQAPTASQIPQILRPYDSELILCQRHLLTLSPSVFCNGHTDAITIPIYMNHGMRVAPSLTHPYSDASFTSAGIPGASQWNLQDQNVATATKTGTASFSYSASAYAAQIGIFGMAFNRVASFISAGTSMANIKLDARM